MTNIFIDIPILLEYRSQVAKCVFLGYHLTIESNIPSSCVVALKSYFMNSVLDLLSLKTFASKVRLHNSNFWSTPVLFSSTKTTSPAKSIHHGIQLSHRLRQSSRYPPLPGSYSHTQNPMNPIKTYSSGTYMPIEISSYKEVL
jgi:hypothetical protein